MEKLIILQGVKLDDLLSQIDQLIEKKLTEHLNSPKPKEQSKYLSRKEAAELLKITLPTLYDWTKLGWLKSYRIGHRILYKEREIEASLIQRKFRKNQL